MPDAVHLMPAFAQSVGLVAIGLSLLIVAVTFGYRVFQGRHSTTMVSRMCELEKREQLYRILAVQASDGLVLVRDERITFTFARLSNLVDVVGDSMLGQPFIELIHPDHRISAREDLMRLMDGDNASYRFETILVNPVGKAVRVEIGGASKEFGGVRTHFLILRDISERVQKGPKHACSDARRHTSNRLMQAYQIEARDSANWIEQPHNGWADFTVSACGEMHMPISAVLGLTELLTADVFGPLSCSQREALQTVSENVRQLRDQVDAVSHLSSLESGHLQPIPSDVDFLEFCEACMRCLSLSSSRKGVNLVFEAREPPRRGVVDERILRHILVNLLGNAVKFTPSGGSVALVVSQQGGDDAIDFTVSATGGGISRERLEAIFEPFEADGCGKGRGVGLGLAMARRLATMLGGTLTARSTPGQGSSFTLRIPCPPVPAEPAPAAPANESLLGLRILVAEDEPVSARMLELQLWHAGAAVTLVSNGREAVSRARARRPDVVLMDVHMPVMGGIEATAALKGDPLTAGIPVICLTVLAMDEDRDRCLAAGADDFLIKPVEMRALISKLRRQPAGSKKPEDLVGRRE